MSTKPVTEHDPTTTPPFPGLNAAMSRIQTRFRRPSAVLPAPTVLGRVKKASDSSRASLSKLFQLRKRGYVDETPLDDRPVNVEVILGRAPDYHAPAMPEYERVVPTGHTLRQQWVFASLWEVLHANPPYPGDQSEELEEEESSEDAPSKVQAARKTEEQQAGKKHMIPTIPILQQDKAIDTDSKTPFQSLDAVVEQNSSVTFASTSPPSSRPAQSSPRPPLRRKTGLAQLPRSPSASEHDQAFKQLGSKLEAVRSHSLLEDSSVSSSQVSKAVDPRTVPPTRDSTMRTSARGLYRSEGYARLPEEDVRRTARRRRAVEDLTIFMHH